MRVLLARVAMLSVCVLAVRAATARGQAQSYGALWNHIWSVVGHDDRADVNSTFIHPFVGYTTRTAWTYVLNTESSYEWKADAWSVPIHRVATKVVKFGTQPVSIGRGLRCWATSLGGGPRGCGFRLIVTPLFPKE